MEVQVALLSQSFGGRGRPPLLPPSHLVKTELAPCYAMRRLRVGWSPRFRSSLRRLATQAQANLIHDQGLWLQTNHVAARTARGLNLPLIISPRGMASAWAIRHKAWKKRLAWWLYQRQDMLVAKAFHVTCAAEAECLRQLGFRQPIAIIPNGVDLPEVMPPLARPSGIRTGLFLGRIHPCKGLLDLVEACASLRLPGWRFLIVGPDENGHCADVQAAVRARQLEDVFTFLPPVDDSAKWELYRSADLFVSPTFAESFGLTIAEALSFGLPVITTQGTPWSELQTHRCGWWVERGAKSLALALSEATALSDAERWAMGERGRQLIAARYSWRGIAAQMRAVYDWTLGYGPKPACMECDERTPHHAH
jgi:glycosyltransferase involved in cell wall biosynthesis